VQTTSYKSGFVGVVGEPNAGKSTLLNWLVGEKIALVSKKANATRKSANAIIMHKENQIVLVDTPGIHEQEKLLNKYMISEALKVLVDSDLILYIADIRRDTNGYKRFLELNKKNIPHFLVLTKIDLIDESNLNEKVKEYKEFDNYVDIITISSTQNINQEVLLDSIVEHLPVHPYYYDPEIITTENIRDIYKELIREALFNRLDNEIPYESDIIIEKIIEKTDIDKIYAQIITQRDSQKSVIIGKKGSKIKEIGVLARKLLQDFARKKVYLELHVKTVHNWTKKKSMLEEVGYIES
jgi:GTP-binding protein Era